VAAIDGIVATLTAQGFDPAAAAGSSGGGGASTEPATLAAAAMRGGALGSAFVAPRGRSALVEGRVRSAVRWEGEEERTTVPASTAPDRASAASVIRILGNQAVVTAEAAAVKITDTRDEVRRIVSHPEYRRAAAAYIFSDGTRIGKLLSKGAPCCHRKERGEGKERRESVDVRAWAERWARVEVRACGAPRLQITLWGRRVIGPALRTCTVGGECVRALAVARDVG
jgi:hypothetical protein